MRIGIIGCGPMGIAIGTRWAVAGHQVTFAYSRDAEKPSRVAFLVGHGAAAGSISDAIKNADALLVAVPWRQLDDLIPALGALRDRVIIDCGLPMNDAGSELVVGWQSSGAEQLARALNSPVVKAFNTVPAEFISADRVSNRASIFVAGDDADSKAVAMDLVSDCAFDPIDVGPLKMSRYLEPFALLMGQIAYVQQDNPEVGYRLVVLDKSRADEVLP